MLFLHTIMFLHAATQFMQCGIMIPILEHIFLSNMKKPRKRALEKFMFVATLENCI